MPNTHRRSTLCTAWHAFEPSATRLFPHSSMAASSAPPSRPVPRSFRKPLADVDPYMAIDSARWLRIHGRPPPPKISDTQRKELDQCFKLIDTDRGGTVDATELGNALQLLGIKASKQEIADMLHKAGADEASELDSDAFKRIMTGVLTKSDATPTTAAQADTSENDANMTSCLSFDTTATIYRRKKLLQALQERDHATLATLVEYQAEQAKPPTATDTASGLAQTQPLQ